MALGMQKAKDKVEAAADCGNAYALFGLAGKTMLMSMGGASGVLFGSLFLGEMCIRDRYSAAMKG